MVDYEFFGGLNPGYASNPSKIAHTGGTYTPVWEAAQRLVQMLKQCTVAPWVTRGSSRIDRSNVATYSATPDGVDRWTGFDGPTNLMLNDAFDFLGFPDGSSVVWHVLENTVSGYQICIMAGATNTAPALALILSKNKFETAGTWRAGGTSATVRPTDTASSPAYNREISTGRETGGVVVSFTFPSAGVWSQRLCNRPDGRGFYYWVINGLTETTGNAYMMGTAPVTGTPLTLSYIQNNQIVLHSRQADLDNQAMNQASPNTNWSGGPLNYSIKGMVNAVVKNFGIAQWDLVSGTFAGIVNGVDPEIGRRGLLPLLLYTESPSPGAVRLSLPDVYYSSIGISNPATEAFRTHNLEVSKPRVLAHLGVSRIVFPWPGLDVGAATADNRASYLITAGAEEPAPAAIVDPKKFNLGLEII